MRQEGTARFLLVALSIALCCLPAMAGGAPDQRETPRKPQSQQPEAQEQEDPFADLSVPRKPAEEAPKPSRHSWKESFFKENFGFRKEIMSQFDTSQDLSGASRQSVGFELLKKFSTATETVASFNFQGRLVRRDGFNPVQNDMEGQMRPGWAFEYHNFYLDFYNVLDPLFREGAKAKQLGRFNLRAGRFYVPFGLNLQTDTHGTVLQLSNDRNFGFERDWYTGFWGALNKHLNYDAYYLAGSGYDLKYQGQSGLGAFRLSLGNRFRSEYGLEGGVSLIGGERLSRESNGHSAATMSPARVPLDTRRAGVDARYSHSVPNGLLTLTTEASGGRDAQSGVVSHLHQAEFLHSSRRWGLASQYRRFTQEGLHADASLSAEFTWYVRNDVGNSNLHWIKLNVERQLERPQGPPATVIVLQYYFYR